MANPYNRNRSSRINKDMLTIEIEKMIREGGLGADLYYDLRRVAQNEDRHNNN